MSTKSRNPSDGTFGESLLARPFSEVFAHDDSHDLRGSRIPIATNTAPLVRIGEGVHSGQIKREGISARTILLGNVPGNCLVR
jgi:hypothetical protein